MEACNELCAMDSIMSKHCLWAWIENNHILMIYNVINIDPLYFSDIGTVSAQTALSTSPSHFLLAAALRKLSTTATANGQKI